MTKTVSPHDLLVRDDRYEEAWVGSAVSVIIESPGSVARRRAEAIYVLALLARQEIINPDKAFTLDAFTTKRLNTDAHEGLCRASEKTGSEIDAYFYASSKEWQNRIGREVFSRLHINEPVYTYQALFEIVLQDPECIIF